MSRLWHIRDLRSDWGDEDGWYVHAETSDAARQAVIDEREAQYRQSMAEHPDWGFDRVTYFGGDPISHVGEPVEITDTVVAVPFLGYTW